MIHIPVMKNEVVDYMNVRLNGTYVDMTLGFAGHSSEILHRLNNTGHLYGVDQDMDAINYCQNDPLLKSATNFTILHMNFVYFKKWAEKNNLNKVDGFLFDLGVSSHQINEVRRGFSYTKDCDLDMRMDQTKKVTAKQLLDTLSFKELVDVFRKYGEIRRPQQVVSAIIRNRNKINTTKDLVSIINANTPPAIRFKHNINQHIEKKFFLALRIMVNEEITTLEKAIYDAAMMLNKNGRIVVLAYHSLEISCIKHKLTSLTKDLSPRDLPVNFSPPDFFWVTKKNISPTAEEIAVNNRSHSAKLMCLERRN